MIHKINCLVVDDEELARDLMENYIGRLSHLNLVGKCANPLEAMQVLQDQEVDLIFLDIQMPELTGIEFLRTLTHKPLVVFTTAYKEYALDGFDLDVADYLLKPFRFERFLQAVNKASTILKNSNSTLESKPVTEENDKNKHLLIKSDFKVFRVKYEDISHIESMKEYVAFHTNLGRKLSLGSLKKLQLELPNEEFIRVHKSFIVNVKHIVALEGNMIHIGDKKIPVGASFKVELMKRFF